jgi:hypothetical protein
MVCYQLIFLYILYKTRQDIHVIQDMLFPSLYYSLLFYFGFEMSRPILFPFAKYIYNFTINNNIGHLNPLDLKMVFSNKDTIVYIFEKHFNFLKLEFIGKNDHTYNLLDLDDFNYVESFTDQSKIHKQKIKLGDNNCMVSFASQEDINKNLIDYLIIKCDSQLIFKHLVFTRFFEISGITKKKFDYFYSKYNYLVLNLKDSELYYIN